MSRSLAELSPDDCLLCNKDLQEQVSPGQALPEPPITELDQSLQAEILYHTRLEPLEDWQIRVLEVFASSPNDPLLKAKLWNADMLHDQGVLLHGTKIRVGFSAISYHWGEDRTPRHPISCNGVDYPITLQAYRALQRAIAAKNCVSVYLWIDSICINQHDLAERAKEITKMLSIFSKAETVLAYLGEPRIADWTSPAMCIFGWLKYQRGICYNHLLSIVPQGTVELSTPWFARLWIRQEVWAATTIEALYGPQSLDWEILRISRHHLFHVEERMRPESPKDFSLVEVFYKKIESLARSDPVQRAMTQIPDQRKDVNSAHNYSYRRYLRSEGDDIDCDVNIFSVLRLAIDNECERAHDRIYGLLGMCRINLTTDSADFRRFFVSYEEPAVLAFARLAKYIISQDRSLDILRLRRLCSPKGSRARSQDHLIEGKQLPSWVVDWRFEYELPYLEPPGVTDTAKVITSALELPAQYGSMSLSLNGYRWGKLTPRSEEAYLCPLTFHWTDSLQISTEDSVADYAIPYNAESGDLVVRIPGYYWVLIIRPTTCSSEPADASRPGLSYYTFVATMDHERFLVSQIFSKLWFRNGNDVHGLERHLEIEEIILV